MIVKEMMDLLCLDLVQKKLVTKSITLHVSYSSRLNMPSAHGTAALSDETNSDLLLIPAVSSLYEKIVDRSLMIKRLNITCNNVMPEENHQYNLFVDAQEMERNRKVQEAVLSIKNKFGKNAILKGMNLKKTPLQGCAIHRSVVTGAVFNYITRGKIQNRCEISPICL